MYVVNVQIVIKPEFMDRFISSTKENIKKSLLEKGIWRFELIQKNDDSSHFLLVEGYIDEEAMLEHKNTLHYQKWRDEVVEMMQEQRFSIKYKVISQGVDLISHD